MKKILFLFILSSFITACRQHKKTYIADVSENAITIDSFYHKENIFKYTQLGIECKKGNLDNVKQLLTKGANSRFAKKDDYLIYDALFVSIENRHLPIVKYLVENNISDINQIYTEEGLTPLGLARKIGDKEIVSYLIEQGGIKYSSDCLYNPQNEMYQKLKRNVHFLSGG